MDSLSLIVWTSLLPNAVQLNSFKESFLFSCHGGFLCYVPMTNHMLCRSTMIIRLIVQKDHILCSIFLFLFKVIAKIIQASPTSWRLIIWLHFPSKSCVLDLDTFCSCEPKSCNELKFDETVASSKSVASLSVKCGFKHNQHNMDKTKSTKDWLQLFRSDWLKNLSDQMSTCNATQNSVVLQDNKGFTKWVCPSGSLVQVHKSTV